MPLTPERCKAICDERLPSWVAKLVSCNATPLALLGVAHDGSGTVVICTVEGQPGMDDRQIADLIIGCGHKLKRGAKR